jgi:hypothetical protein
MKYVTVTIGRDPNTGLLTIDRKATRAKILAVKKNRARKTSIKSLANVSAPVKKGGPGVPRSTASMARTGKR